MRITNTKETVKKLYLVTIFPKAQPFSYEVELFVTTEKNTNVEKLIYNHLDDLTNKNNQLVIEFKEDVNFLFKRTGEKQTRIRIMMIDKSEIGGIDIKYLREANDNLEGMWQLRRSMAMTEAEKAEQTA